MKKSNQMSRRKFLAIGAGATAATLIGGGLMATRAPKVNFIETTSCQIGTAKDKVLVVYASRYGSTGQVASQIANTLVDQGIEADVKLIDKNIDLSPYTSIIVGSPVRIGQWLPEATEFVQQHQEKLNQKKVAYFLTSMTLATSQEQDERAKIKEIFTDLEQKAPEITLMGKGYFAGALDLSQMSFAMAAAFKVMTKIADKPLIQGNYIDSEAISTWTNSLIERMNPA